MSRSSCSRVISRWPRRWRALELADDLLGRLEGRSIDRPAGNHRPLHGGRVRAGLDRHRDDGAEQPGADASGALPRDAHLRVFL